MSAHPESSPTTPPQGPTLRRGNPEAAGRIWAWNHAEHTRETLAQQTRAARKRGTIQALVTALMAALLFWIEWRIPAFIASAIAGLTLLGAMVSPTGLFAGIERLVAWTARRLGIAASWLMLVPLFYLFFVPFVALFRRGARDRLRRSYATGAESYWNQRSPDGPDPKRQF